jgi:ribonuclease P protein component
MSQRFTLKKAEKLKSRKRIERVFREGKSFTLFPYRVIFLLQPMAALAGGGSDAGVSEGASATVGDWAPLQAGFGASSRHFKKAVDRNRIKRLGREAYRLQKQPLLRQLAEKGFSMAVFFIYTGRELPVYATVTEKIGVALQKLIKEIA